MIVGFSVGYVLIRMLLGQHPAKRTHRVRKQWYCRSRLVLTDTSPE